MKTSNQNQPAKNALPITILRRIRDVITLVPRLRRQVRELQAANHRIERDTETFKQHMYKYQDEYGHAINRLDVRMNDVVHQLAVMNERLAALGKPSKQSPDQSAKSSDLLADEHLLDNFYVEFERWFRGSDAEIKERQRIYVPYFTESKIDSSKHPVVDIGCGRGEFVELLGEHKVRAIGLDLNKTMVQNVKDKGLEAVQNDALTYLRKQKAESLLAVTGFHIVEHIPFVDLVKIVDEAYRTLARGGFVIFETPNPENLIVGACNFYADPSHLNPLPPAFLEFTLKTRGFNKIEVKRLHPMKPTPKNADPLVTEIAERVFGPQNYAVIAYK